MQLSDQTMNKLALEVISSLRQAGEPSPTAKAQAVLLDAKSFAPQVLLNVASGGYFSGGYASNIGPWIDRCAQAQMQEGGDLVKALVQGVKSAPQAWGGAKVRVTQSGTPRVAVDGKDILVHTHWVIEIKTATPNNRVFRDAFKEITEHAFFEFSER